MTIERCNKAGSGFECVRLAGHEGACDLVSSEAYAKAMQSTEDYFLKGEPGVTPREGGLLGKRADVAITDGFKPLPCCMCGDTGIQGPEQGVTFGGGACYCDAGKAIKAKHDANIKAGCNCNSRSDHHRAGCKLFVDHQDEIGKVWDVLHAAGVNSAGGVSASEGVKQLVAKLHAVKKLANERFGRTSPLSLCDKCNGCGWEQPDVAIEVCSKCGGKGVLV